MSASVKQQFIPDAAAAELWRVAESGDVAELARILPRVGNINARNQHGMTALMRAAYHGHERMVRALLDHGADPNLTRNDKFTALALAAFFGHTETVRILIEHGAKTEVVTRCGASARTWATARTFTEVARCLETHTPPRSPAVVKTLKDPPEIWDLVQVQEVPRSFNARSAFLSRLKSMNGSFAFRAAAVLLVAVACVIGALMFRGSQARSLPPDVASDQTANVKPLETVENHTSKPSVSAAPTEVNDPATEPVSNNNHASEFPVENGKRSSSRKTLLLIRPARARSTAAEGVVESAPSREAPAPPVVATPQTESRNSNKPNNSLSPQLITPAKGASPKAKVIQWP